MAPNHSRSPAGAQSGRANDCDVRSRSPGVRWARQTTPALRGTVAATSGGHHVRSPEGHEEDVEQAVPADARRRRSRARPWDYGDCQVQVDLWDEPSHRARARGPLVAAFEIYRLSPKEPPTGVEAKLLWDIGRAADGFIDRLFAGGIVCPFRAEAPADAEERSE